MKRVFSFLYTGVGAGGMAFAAAAPAVMLAAAVLLSLIAMVAWRRGKLFASPQRPADLSPWTVVSRPEYRAAMSLSAEDHRRQQEKVSRAWARVSGAVQYLMTGRADGWERED
ncbi:MAG: hypothetical protein KGI84_07545 [Elusimicrobia bacterium]|nr:hypothetical protein [Elusimicrobiota bacterium]